eukprot:GILK01005528.1.p1 GENE.GILK01005528.1~~GILK01005528.1.p1  ORF type:complete len:1787 (-),score=532.29 GILK01005528.1:93-5426(-)
MSEGTERRRSSVEVWGEGEEVGKAKIPDDFYYQLHEVVPRPSPQQLPAEFSNLVRSFGFHSHKRYNLHYIADNVLLYVMGNVVCLLDVDSMQQTYVTGMDGGGVSAVAVHPSRSCFAVAEKGLQPNIYVYEYPSLKLYRILRKGTELAYSHLDFDGHGETLASVGSAPDFMLTVWDWRQERVLLRAKAFSQDVFRVTFSSLDGQLTTSGVGHIRFWKMARTFTGLKLQGDIGKFGHVELSDICGYVDFPDGKVLSGTEKGVLLLWDGNVIKCEIKRKDGMPCHHGAIEAVMIEDDKIVTAGADGYIRWWDFRTIDQAEANTSMDNQVTPFEVEPIKQVHLQIDNEPLNQQPAVTAETVTGEGETVKEEKSTSRRSDSLRIRAMVRGRNHYLIQDESGHLWKLDDHGFSKKLFSFHSGPVASMDVAFNSHMAVTTGTDATVRLWSYLEQKVLLTQQFGSGGTVVRFAPPAVDNTGMTVAVGFESGVIRILQICNESFAIKYRLKPHNKAVTAVAYSVDGTKLATADAEGVVFFFNVEKYSYEPLGFVRTSSTVQSLDFSEDSQRILIGCCNGDIFEFMRPELEVHGQSTSFEMKLKHRIYKVDGPTVLQELKRHEQSKEPQPVAEDGTAPLETVEEELPTVTSVTTYCAIYASASELLISGSLVCEPSAADSKQNSFVIRTSFIEDIDEEEREKNDFQSFKIISKEPNVTTLRINSSRKLLLGGTRFGAAVIKPLTSTERFVRIVSHDATSGEGQVGSLALSFDDRYLLTVGADGGMFLHLVATGTLARTADHMLTVADISDTELVAEAAVERQLEQETRSNQPYVHPPLQPVQDLAEAPLPDLANENEAYSIQEEKLKLEEDKRSLTAEGKKELTRNAIRDIRSKLEDLMDRNKDLGPLKLLANELLVDPAMEPRIRSQIKDRIDETKKEMLWESAYQELRLNKLKHRFLDDIEIERIVLKAFKSKMEVSSFRVPKRSAFLEAQLNAVNQVLKQEEEMRRVKDRMEKRSSSILKKTVNISEFEATKTKPAGTRLAMDMSLNMSFDSRMAASQEERKQARESRKRNIEELMRQKPDEQSVDKRDVDAIDLANRTLGDYKLKTSSTYIVPDEERVDADKKRKQMVLLEDSVRSIKMNFNERFLALRDLKKRIISNILRDSTRIKQINAELGMHHEQVWTPVLQMEEFPEQRYEVSRDELVNFEREKQRRAKRLAREAKRSNGLSFGGNDEEENDSEDDIDSKSQVNSDLSEDEDIDESAQRRINATSTLPRKTVIEKKPSVPSAFEQEMKQVRYCRLQHEKRLLLNKIEKTTETFDAAVKDLMVQRFKLVSDLKCTDLRLITLNHELDLLKDLEKRDLALEAKLDKFKSEKNQIVNEIAECQLKLATKRTDIENWQVEDRQIMDEFNSLIGESSPFYAALMKIFKKKMKRSKKSAGMDAEDFDDDENWEDEEMEDEEEEDVCPPGCDIATYQKILELRDTRLDHEEVLLEFQKTVEELRKTNDRLFQREKSVDKELRSTETEIQTFQTEKQSKLNELKTVVTLKVEQVQCFFDNEQGESMLPEELSRCLVFTNGGLHKLRHRAEEIKTEKKQLRESYKDLRKEYVAMVKDKQKKLDDMAELNRKYQDIQILKFGSTINIDLLSANTGINPAMEELKGRLEDASNRSESTVVAVENKLSRAKQTIREQISLNSRLYESIENLSRRHYQLDRDLEGTMQTSQVIASDEGPAKEKEEREKQQMYQLVKLQTQELETLKQEVNLLRRKGSVIYPQTSQGRMLA